MADYSLLVKPLPNVVLANGAIGRIGKHVQELGCRRAFLVSDPGVRSAGLVGKVKELLEKSKLEVFLFDDVPANPTFDAVAAGIAVVAGRWDGLCVVALGGGSSMDAAKTMAVVGPDIGGKSKEEIVAVLGEYTMYPTMDKNGNVDRAAFRPRRAAQAKPAAIIAVPTTSGTASETNGAAVLTDEAAQRKVIFSDDRAVAQLAVMDPGLTLGLPRYPTATCGMDVLTHAIEALTSARRNPYSGAIAMGAIELVAKYLPRLMKDLKDGEARLRLMTASHMAGAAFGIAGLGICHAVGHPLSAVLHQAHGQTLATMLPHVMRFNMEQCLAEYEMVAGAFGVKREGATQRENAEAAVRAVAKLSIEVGTARSIRAMGGQEETIPMLVEQALLDVCMLATPRPPSASEVAALYRLAWQDPELYPETPSSKL